MRPFTALIPLLAFIAAASGDSLPEGWTAGASCLFGAEAGARWVVDHAVLDSTGTDVSVSLTARSQVADILVTAAVTASDDSVAAASLRRMRAMLRWPGTPWIGAGAFLGEGAPFVPGLEDPLVEYGWIAPDSVRGMSLSAGGFLGFRGSYALALTPGDTLVSTHARSPWLGFAGFDYSRTAVHPASDGGEVGSVLNVLTIRADLRYVKPWVLVAGAEGEQDNWAVEAEIRGFRPLETEWGRLELVPGMSFAGDSFSSPGSAFVPGMRVLTLRALMRPERVMAGAGITVSVDLEGDSLTFVSLMGHMISRAGLSYALTGTAREDGWYRAAAEIGTSDGGAASAFLGGEIIEDSLRVTGRALYSPRPDVNGTLTVSGDAGGSLDPTCGLDLSALVGPVTGHIGIAWLPGDVLLTIELGGLLR